MQRLFINESLTKRLMKDPTAKEFIGEKLRNAQWLIRAIEQRRKTIIRVAECIVEKQRDFFEKGVASPEADDPARRGRVGRHARIDDFARDDEQVHAHASGPVRAQVLLQLEHPARRQRGHRQRERQAGHQEDHRRGGQGKSQLSDQAIVEILEKQEGIKIARRTVAKYREMLGILASSKRKRLF